MCVQNEPEVFLERMLLLYHQGKRQTSWILGEPGSTALTGWNPSVTSQ